MSSNKSAAGIRLRPASVVQPFAARVMTEWLSLFRAGYGWGGRLPVRVLTRSETIPLAKPRRRLHIS